MLGDRAEQDNVDLRRYDANTHASRLQHVVRPGLTLEIAQSAQILHAASDATVMLFECKVVFTGGALNRDARRSTKSAIAQELIRSQKIDRSAGAEFGEVPFAEITLAVLQMHVSNEITALRKRYLA